MYYTCILSAQSKGIAKCNRGFVILFPNDVKFCTVSESLFRFSASAVASNG